MGGVNLSWADGGGYTHVKCFSGKLFKSLLEWSNFLTTTYPKKAFIDCFYFTMDKNLLAPWKWGRDGRSMLQSRVGWGAGGNWDQCPWGEKARWGILPSDREGGKHAWCHVPDISCGRVYFLYNLQLSQMKVIQKTHSSVGDVRQ